MMTKDESAVVRELTETLSMLQRWHARMRLLLYLNMALAAIFSVLVVVNLLELRVMCE